MNRSRGWCFTINNYNEDDENVVYDWAWDSKYICVGREVGEQLTPHLQGFIYYNNARTFNQMKQKHESAHWEQMEGTPKQAADYCKKDGDFFEWGTPPFTQEQKGECGKQSIKERWELAKQGKFEELPPELIKTYEYIYSKFQEVEDRPTLENIWIFGPSGCGKSRWVRDNYPQFYNKGMNKWWDGYQREDVILLDDMDLSHGKFIGYFLKIWADHYAFNAEVKGGMLKIRPKIVIVTSQYTIEQVFQEERETINALHRRFKRMNWNPLFNTFSGSACEDGFAPRLTAGPPPFIR